MEKSIHELITELCDKHIDKRKCINESINIHSVIKKLRIKAFEILLKKQKAKGCVNELEGNTDPICHLLAWQYTLKHSLSQPETAEALNIFIERLKSSELLADSTVQNIMLFLLYLRGKNTEVEQENLKHNIFDKVTLKHKSSTESTALPYDLYPEHRFHFANPLNSPDQQSVASFSTKSFSLQPTIALRISKSNRSLKPMEEVLKYSSDFKFVPLTIGGIRTINSKEIIVAESSANDEGYESPVKECFREDIWEIASKMPVNEYKTWESLENIDPVKELAFACESGPKTLHDFEKILDANSYKCVGSEKSEFATNVISSARFTKKVKYMLVGMASDEFLINDKGMFYLREGVCVEGVSSCALTSYCSDLLCCGSCYRALHQLCSSYPRRDNEKYGYVFNELCESIKRYLAYYRVAALSVPDTTSLLAVHAHMHRLRDQICALARMCRVATFSACSDENQVPHGIELLNYMYQEIVKTTDNNIGLVLYSAFYPCCQVYFSRFLQRWLFEGLLIDPYEEFMVKAESHYTNSRARTYWTRSFSLRQNAVPDFLTDLKTDILQCGRTMNLLKLCNPDAPLYTDILGRSVPLISCCLTPEQVAKLRQEIDYYYIEMAALCGPRVSLYHKLIERYEDNVLFLSLVEKKRALTIQKMEMLKQQGAEEKAKIKRKIFEELKEQMLLAAEHKKKAKEEELHRDLQIAKQNAQMEEMRVKLLKEETQEIIKYYHNLIEAVDKRRDSIDKRKQQIVESSKLDKKEIMEIMEPVLETTSDTKKEENSDVEIQSDADSKSVDEIKESSSMLSTDNSDKDTRNTEDVKKEMGEIENVPILDVFSSENEETGTAKVENTNKNVALSEISSQSTTRDNKKDNFDIVNANIDSPTESVKLNNQLNENFLAAQRNKAKILNLEFGVKFKEPPKKEIIVIDKDNLTDAQRNKLKVLSSEYNLFSDGSKTVQSGENTSTPDSEHNGNTATSKTTKPEIMLPTQENENNNDEQPVTNWNVTGNLASPGHENVMNILHRKKILTLPKQTELPTVFENNFRTSVANIQNEVTPMSIDSTPNTECPPTELPTPSSSKLLLCTNHMTESMFTLDSALLTANSNITDDGFKFPQTEPQKFIYENSTKLFFADKKKMFNIAEDIPHSARPMRLSKDEVKKISNCNLKLLLYQSVQVPLEAQVKLVNGEMLKYFINHQHFFSHLHSLRCYYFLLDGEFGRNITEGLFNKLYEAKNPADMLNCRSLQLIINRALYASSKTHENADRLSFIVQTVPNSFDLSNADVLECLSLSYRINWPLNILLPCDTIEKYDIVFKYLLKLHYMSWILQKMCKELKVTQKEHGVDELLLMRSPQYHKLQLYRHIMTHFVQTLQNYTVSEVLQTSWAELENNMKTVNTLDQLYAVHILYVKTIIFRCLLNKKCAPIMKVINEIFIVILKFYNYLRSRTWNIKENDLVFTHPNFKKLEDIFNKFQEFTKFVFRVGNKMARVGYQPHLVQMLDMLNINDYYTNKQNT